MTKSTINLKEIILPLLLIISFFSISLASFSYPNKTYAVFPVADVDVEFNTSAIMVELAEYVPYDEAIQADIAAASDATWYETSWTAIQTSWSALSNAATQLNTYQYILKEYVLDGLARSAAQAMIRQITKATVSWINSGFNGNPAFVNNPARFFTNVVDDALGDFISGTKLNWLCNSFSAKIKLGLALNAGGNRKPPTCSLSDIIENTYNAVDNSGISIVSSSTNSISLITKYRTGTSTGTRKNKTTVITWSDFASNTMIPTNHPFGAAMQADADASREINTALAQKNTDLNRGQGFMSWQTCKTYSKESECLEYGAVAGYDSEGNEVQNMGCVKYGEPKCLEKETQTPGSVIQGQINSILPSDMRQLEVANEINEILSALMGQVMEQVLGAGGLLGLSGSRGGGGGTTLDKIIASATAESDAQNAESLASFTATQEENKKKIADQETINETTFNKLISTSTATMVTVNSTSDEANIKFKENASSTVEIYSSDAESFSNTVSFYSNGEIPDLHINTSLLKKSNLEPLIFSTIFDNLKTKITQGSVNADTGVIMSQETVKSLTSLDITSASTTIEDNLTVKENYLYKIKYTGKTIKGLTNGNYILRTKIMDGDNNTINYQDISFYVSVI